MPKLYDWSELDPVLRRMVDDGHTGEECAAALNVHPKSARDRIKHLGLQLGKLGPATKCRNGHVLFDVGYVPGSRKCLRCLGNKQEAQNERRRRTLPGEGTCRNGHDLAVVGVYFDKRGGRGKCSECVKEQGRKVRERARAAAAAARAAGFTPRGGNQAEPAGDPDAALEMFVASETAMPWEREPMKEQARKIARGTA